MFEYKAKAFRLILETAEESSPRWKAKHTALHSTWCRYAACSETETSLGQKNHSETKH